MPLFEWTCFYESWHFVKRRHGSASSQDWTLRFSDCHSSSVRTVVHNAVMSGLGRSWQSVVNLPVDCRVQIQLNVKIKVLIYWKYFLFVGLFSSIWSTQLRSKMWFKNNEYWLNLELEENERKLTPSSNLFRRSQIFDNRAKIYDSDRITLNCRTTLFSSQLRLVFFAEIRNDFLLWFLNRFDVFNTKIKITRCSRSVRRRYLINISKTKRWRYFLS